MTTITTSATTGPAAPCGCGGDCGSEARDDPYTSVSYHFGMLLGVDDFETEQGYHRGKHRLHNAWLHGAGVVWGFAVGVDEEHCEITVAPGLALDGAGHELHLDGPACLNPGAWWEKNVKAADEAIPAQVTIDAHVQARWRSCQNRPVPALATPCEGSETETECSRTVEVIDLTLEPGLAVRPPGRYHLVRLLLGLDAPDGAGAHDAEVTAAVAAIAAASAADRPGVVLEALRRFAAFDTIAMGPATTPESEPATREPVLDDTPVVLANITGLELEHGPAGWSVSAPGTIDYVVRPSHIATETIEELVCCCLVACGGPDSAPAPAPAPAPVVAPTPAPAPAGTTITNVTVAGQRLTLKAGAALDPRTVHPGAFTVTALGKDDWEEIAVDKAAYQKSRRTIVLSLHDAPAPPWRVVARGTGSTPILDAQLKPLARGTDFVHMEDN